MPSRVRQSKPLNRTAPRLQSLTWRAINWTHRSSRRSASSHGRRELSKPSSCVWHRQDRACALQRHRQQRQLLALRRQVTKRSAVLALGRPASLHLPRLHQLEPLFSRLPHLRQQQPAGVALLALNHQCQSDRRQVLRPASGQLRRLHSIVFETARYRTTHQAARDSLLVAAACWTTAPSAPLAAVPRVQQAGAHPHLAPSHWRRPAKRQLRRSRHMWCGRLLSLPRRLQRRILYRRKPQQRLSANQRLQPCPPQPAAQQQRRPLQHMVPVPRHLQWLQRWRVLPVPLRKASVQAPMQSC